MLADVGIPMIFVQWPLMFCALIPVVIVEALLIRRWVSLSPREAFSGVAKANFVSTLVGIPLAWVAMLAVEFAVMLPAGLAAEQWHWNLRSPILQVVGFALSIAWIAPFNTYWSVPAATALLLIPSFYVSVWLERLVCFRAWPTTYRATIRRGVYLSNLASYLVLFVAACGWVTYELMTKKPTAD
jgi:hypothetical protein